MNLTSSVFHSLFILGSFLAVNAIAQSGKFDTTEKKDMLNAQLRAEDERNKKRVEKSLEIAGKEGRTNSALGKLYLSEKELPAAEKKLLATNLEEAQKHEAFLRQPDTGLFKLLNLKETKLAVNDVKSQSAYPQMTGGGTFYSFAKRSHTADEWAQIRLKEGIFQPAFTEMKRTTVASSGGVQQSFVFTSGYALSLFTELGDLSLATVTLQTPAIQLLTEISVPSQYQDFIKQVKLYETGIKAGTTSYKSSVPAKLNATYALRCINYKKADVLLAFQVVHDDGEGNLHILWKQLALYPPPELKGKPQK